MKPLIPSNSILPLLLALLLSLPGLAQSGTVTGVVRSKGEAIPFATVQVLGTSLGATADGEGNFKVTNISAGAKTLQAGAIGFRTSQQKVEVLTGEIIKVSFTLQEDKFNLNEVVVTGTRTAKRKTESPVIVNLIDSKQLDQVVAATLSDGLRFQPGLRVETDCQTCNYTQLRMNGLQGGYSQILVNSRAIFSPLMGLYGMEQIPVNMIERIEVVRGGGSSLYGSSAVGGTVNIITKIPDRNAYDITNTYQSIDGRVGDNLLAANATVVNDERNAGATFFVNNRERKAFDANGDNFSEAPALKNNSFGTNFFYKPTENQKLEGTISSLYEYRYGGEMVDDKPAYLAQQSEERMHNIKMASLSYQIDFNDKKQSLSLYYGGQQTDRKHYTGTIPDEQSEIDKFVAAPPYGISDVTTHQGGVQFNNRIDGFLGGTNMLTAGSEYVYDKVQDEIKTYNYKIDQTTKNLGVFLQSDWNITPQFNFVSGVRFDKHNLVSVPIVSPRLSFLYKLKENTQFRVGLATGFRAPQAFDTDLHIAFAAGGVSRISLAPNLKQERSTSLNASINYDKVTEHFIAGFTVEAFHTYLKDAFFQFPLGEDAFGKLFEKRNGEGATVQGGTLELRANFDYVYQFDAGLTVQTSKYDAPVETIEGLAPKREFLRAPNVYGYGTFTYTPTKFWSASTNFVYTGPMQLAHFGGEGTGQSEDVYLTTRTFTDVSFRLGHTFALEKTKTGIELFGGIKNTFNAYQNDFDKGKNRDSNYIYGPNLPRTYFVGLRVKSL